MMRMSLQAARHTESKISLKSGFRTAKIHVILTSRLSFRKFLNLYYNTDLGINIVT